MRRSIHRRQHPAPPAPVGGSSADEQMQKAFSIFPKNPSSEAGSSLGASLAATATLQDLLAVRSRSWAQLVCSSPAALKARPARQHSHCDAAASKLEALAAQVAAVRQYTDRQAALLADCRTRADSLRRQTQTAQDRLAWCLDEAAAVEQQEGEERAAAWQANQLAAEQINALTHELHTLDTSTAAEQRQLAHATVVALRRADGLEALVRERWSAVEQVKRRCELMQASHKPLTAEEAARQQRSMERYWARW